MEFPIGLFLHIILIPISILSLATPTFKHRSILLSTIIAILLYLAESHPFASDASTSFSLGLLYYLHCGTISKFLSTETPESAYWRVNSQPKEALSYSAFSWRKIKWAMALSINMRGIGWNYQIKNVTPPKRKNESRIEFLMRQVRELMVGFVVMDACCLFLLKVRYSTDLDEGLRNSRNLGWGVWLLCIAVMGVQSYYANSFLYWMLEIIAVGLGFSEPKDWPPLFGPIGRLTTIKYLWGGFWHQGIRKILVDFAHIISNFLHIPRHTAFSSILTVVLAFTTSGLYHGYACYALPYPTVTSPSATIYDRFWAFVVFFMLQPAGIILEDYASREFEKYAKKYDNQASKTIKRWSTVIGYAWVCAWAIISGSVMIDTYLKTEMGLVGTESVVVEPVLNLLGISLG